MRTVSHLWLSAFDRAHPSSQFEPDLESADLGSLCVALEQRREGTG